MESIPQIVRERLKASRPSDGHPDADMLTAFAEKSLSDRERAHVLSHLSQCCACRDVLALALPDTDTPDTIKVPQRHGWMSWPAFRWGFVTAGVVIIGIGILQYQRHVEPKLASMVARQTANQETLTDQLQTKPPQSAPVATPAKPGVSSPQTRPNFLVKDEAKRYLQSNKNENAGANSTVKALESPSRARAMGGPAYGPKAPMQWQTQQQQSPARLGALMPAPSAKIADKGATHGLEAHRAETQNEAVQVATEVPQIASQASPPASPPVAYFDSPASLSVSKTKPAVRPTDVKAEAAGALSSVRWSINAAGKLQRSFDGGSSWQDVDVLANTVPAADLTYPSNMAVVVAKSTAKQISADKKSAEGNPAPPVFRAVAADGHEVWAGGSNSVLYHSVDSGNHWARVIPSFQGSHLGGDVVSVDLSDAQHVNVTTSIPEIWTTGDGGQTWQKQ
jgi:hypothetical protein